MPPENLQPQEHPTEPLLEAGLIQSKQIGDETNSLLEAIIQQNSENNHEPILEAQLMQSENNTNKIVDAIKDRPEVQPVKIVTEQNELADNFFRMLRGQKGEDGHTPTSDELQELILPLIPPLIPEPIKGEDGLTPTEEELLSLIVPLIPEPIKGEDGKTPTKAELRKIIEPLIPEPIKGEDGVSPVIDYKRVVKEAVKQIPPIEIEKQVKEIVEKVSQNTNDTIQSLRSKVASRTYSMGELSDTQSATTGQTMVKQADNTWAPGTASGGSGHTIEDEGTPLTQRDTLNFVGAGVTVTDDSGNDTTIVTIPGGGGGDMLASTYDPANGAKQVAFNDESQYKISLTVGTANADYITDGVADDVQINAAITAAHAAGGGIVTILEGAYAISSSILVKSNVILSGVGKGTILNLGSGAWVDLNGISNVSLRDFSIDAINHSVLTDYGIVIRSCSDVVVENCFLNNMNGFGIFVIANGTSTTQRITIKDNYIRGLGNNDVVGGGPSTVTATVKDISIYGNTIIQDVQTGVYEAALAWTGMRDINIFGNRSFGRMVMSEEMGHHENVRFDGNFVYPALNGTERGGIYHNIVNSPTADTVNVIVSNNYIEYGTIKMFGTSSYDIVGVSITGNIIDSDPLENGIWLTYCQKGAISGNRIDDTTAGVFFEVCKDFIVSGNQISNSIYGVRDISLDSSIIIGVNQYDTISNTKLLGAGIPETVALKTGGVQIDQKSASGTNPKLSITQNNGLAGLEVYEINGVGSVFVDNIYDDSGAKTFYRMRTNGTPVNVLTLKANGYAEVTDEAYDSTTWNGSSEVPTKNAIRDKIESMSAGGISEELAIAYAVSL